MTTYGYVCVSRGRSDDTDTLDNQRMRLAAAGVLDADIRQDIITGAVFDRPGLNDLMDLLEPGNMLIVTALDRLGRDTLGLLELIH